MSKRLQVLMDEEELRDIQKIAKTQHMTVADWVRQTLRSARLRTPLGNAGKKLQAVRNATQHDYPAPDIEQMLAEIELGYHSERK